MSKRLYTVSYYDEYYCGMVPVFCSFSKALAQREYDAMEDKGIRGELDAYDVSDTDVCDFRSDWLIEC